MKIRPKVTPYSFPIDMQKFISKIPFPLYFSGVIYANILVVIATVKPKEYPYMNLKVDIKKRESAK